MIIAATVITYEKDFAAARDAIVTAVACGCNQVCILETTNKTAGAADDFLKSLNLPSHVRIFMRVWPWRNDFSEARNESLRFAKETGADFAFVCDSDERFVSKAADNIHKFIAKNDADIYTVKNVGEEYAKYRIFNLNTCEPLWFGPTHEAYPPGNKIVADAPGFRFFELPKTVEDHKRKCRRDVEILTKHVKKHPNDTRWWFYLAQSYEGLGDLDNAILAYHKSAKVWKSNYWCWKEEAAWACFKMAQIHSLRGRHVDAIESCALGMARFGAMPELSWLSAYSHFQLGDMQQARYWSNNAVAQGSFAGYGKSVLRQGFVFPDAHYQNPFDILHHIAIREGKAVEAQHWKSLYERAKVVRYGGNVDGPSERAEQIGKEDGSDSVG